MLSKLPADFLVKQRLIIVMAHASLPRSDTVCENLSGAIIVHNWYLPWFGRL